MLNIRAQLPVPSLDFHALCSIFPIEPRNRVCYNFFCAQIRNKCNRLNDKNVQWTKTWVNNNQIHKTLVSGQPFSTASKWKLWKRSYLQNKSTQSIRKSTRFLENRAELRRLYSLWARCHKKKRSNFLTTKLLSKANQTASRIIQIQKLTDIQKYRMKRLEKKRIIL